ncbi:unnamed protein product [Hydatigera taeniaeformis]|uniref:SERTA domain-containing protein n=1 Tax=Hydatigena taeniaeformis TaxID=6205 RepID=A0A0R3X386_HYDTA|nr:unnamed protein product [Hydatigera taeniaeformis]
MIATANLSDLRSTAKTSEEYIATLEKKLAQLKGSKCVTSADLVLSINGMKSVVLHDTLMNSENFQDSDVSSEETDPLISLDLLDAVHNMLSEES